MVIAIVGGDGAGKSTTVARVADALSRQFPTERAHLGKPPRSHVSRAARRVLRARRTADGRTLTSLPPWTGLAEFPGYGYALTQLLVARDRAREADRVRRLAARGHIVVCDRHPLEGITTMDTPRLGRVPGLARRPVARWLARRERAHYDRIGRPDLIVVLAVDPDIAVTRRPEQDPDFVRRRAEEIRSHPWAEEDRAVAIDASRAPDEVTGDVLAAVWAAL